MPIYSVKGPDGRIYDVEGPAGASDKQVIAFLQQHLAEQPEQKPKEGLIAGLEKGAESTLSQLRSGIGSIFGSGDEAARAGLARGEDINKRYADQVSWDKVKKSYEEKGLLPAAGEAISQAPYALAEQFPNLAANIGSARLGALAGSLFGPVGSVIGGGAGLVAPSVIQALGGNVERQAALGQKVNVGNALPAAALQGGLDVAGSFIPLGGRLVSKLTGLPVEALLGRTSAQAAKLAEERLLATLSKGTATGVITEIPTEVAQQMLERAQAGLPLTTPDALKEYGETAYQVSLLGPLGAVGRMSEVGGARQQVEKETALDMRQKRMEQLDQEEQNRVAQEAETAKAAQRRQEQLNDPEFAQQAEDKYLAMQTQYADLRKQVSTKVDSNDLAAVEAQNAARAIFRNFKKTDEYKSVMDDYQQTSGARAKLKQQREEQARKQAEADKQKVEADRQKGIQDELAGMKQVRGFQQTIPGLAPMETENVAPKPAGDLTAKRSEFMQKQQELAQLMETHQQKESAAAAKGDIDAIDKLRPQRQMLLNEQEYLAKQLGEMGAEPAEDSLDAIRAKIDKQKAQLQSLGGEGYDPVKADKIINTIRALEEKAKTAKPGQAGLDFGKATKEQVSESTTDFGNRVIGPEIAGGREAAKQAREKTEGEIEGIRRVAATDKTQTPAKEALQDKRTGLEIAAMEKSRLPQDVTEQLDMFGYPLAGGVVTGQEATAPKSRAELVAELRIARTTSNRAAAADLIEQLRNLDAETVGYKSSANQTKTTEAITTAKTAQETQKASNEARMQKLTALRDARDKLDSRYKAAKTADAREKLLPKLEAAEKTYTDAFYEFNAEPVTRRGMANEIKGAAKTTETTGDRKTMDTKGLTQPTVPFAKPAMPGQQPLRTQQQQAYADARAKAYADMVAIVSKYNQGKAKLSELETARGTLVENLIGDIEATRGAPVEKEEADQIRRDANAMLYDLVTRFGDTRNLTQKGTEKRPLFIPAQDSQGNFTSEAQYPTVESRAPGRQTFANPHAAALAIKEGLDDIRNKAVAQAATTVDRTITPEQTTPEALRTELDRAFAKGPDALSAEQRNLLEQVADNLKAINLNPEKRNLVAEYAYRASNGLQIDPSITKDVKDMLAAMEQGKRSETAIIGGEVKRAVQTDLDKAFGAEVLRGRVFDTPEAFEQYLASDALQQMRSTIGMTAPTLSRLVARMAPFLKRAADLQTKVDDLQGQYDAILDKRKGQFAELKKLTGEEAAQEKKEMLRAEEMLKEAETKVKDAKATLAEELRELQTAYLEAEQAFGYSVQVSEDITKAIAANTADFTKAEMAAIADVLKAKKKLTDLFEKLKSDDYPGGRNKGFAEVGPNTDWATRLSSFKNRPEVLELQNEVLAATRRWRANFNLNQSENRIVKFLDQDLNFQMQLQEEAAEMDTLAKNLLNAGTALDLAKQKQNKTVLKQAYTELSTAKEIISEVQQRTKGRAEAVDQLERELGIERKTIRHRMTDDASELHFKYIFNILLFNSSSTFL